MRVCFDYQIFWLQKQGGISRYFCELATHLYALKVCDPHIIAPYHINENLAAIKQKPFVSTLGPVAQKLFHNSVWDKRLRVNEQLLKRQLSKGKDILHETYYTHRLQRRGIRVTTIHDMIYEKFHHGLVDELDLVKAKKRAISEADAVIAVSHSTKRDIVELYPEVKDKTFVVHHGVRLPASDPMPVTGKPYLLFVGNRGWYKNFKTLLEVYASKPALNAGWDIYCFGGELPDEKEMELINRAGINGKIKFLRGDDRLLVSLYSSASVLVYNSAYEGFGMPVLEAMLCGCPVICGNSSSLPEVAGEAALMIDPNEPQQLEHALDSVLTGSLSSRLIAAGKTQAAKFTWEQCARETFKIYEHLA